jgi:hypothetical protein
VAGFAESLEITRVIDSSFTQGNDVIDLEAEGGTAASDMFRPEMPRSSAFKASVMIAAQNLNPKRHPFRRLRAATGIEQIMPPPIGSILQPPFDGSGNIAEEIHARMSSFFL